MYPALEGPPLRVATLLSCALQAIEAFKEKVAALRKKARRVRELERRRLRRMEQRTGARSSAPVRDEVLLHPVMVLILCVLRTVCSQGVLLDAWLLMPENTLAHKAALLGIRAGPFPGLFVPCDLHVMRVMRETTRELPMAREEGDSQVCCSRMRGGGPDVLHLQQPLMKRMRMASWMTKTSWPRLLALRRLLMLQVMPRRALAAGKPLP